MNIVHLLLVGAGGCIGSMTRYLTVAAVDKKLNSIFPYGTLTVNVIGSFALGLLLAWMTKKTGASTLQWKLFLGTGFCGGFTTFSAFAVENLTLAEQKLHGTAALYVFASIAAGILAVWAGFALARTIF